MTSPTEEFDPEEILKKIEEIVNDVEKEPTQEEIKQFGDMWCPRALRCLQALKAMNIATACMLAESQALADAMQSFLGGLEEK